MNVGEISEFCFKAYMLRQRDENREDTVFGKIDELSDDANLADLEWKPLLKQSLDDNDWKTLRDELAVGKSNRSAKMDISINKTRYSMKDVGGNPPAIVNHTARPGYENVCNDVGVSIKKLDIIIKEYWKLREEKIIGEDVKNSDDTCPFLSHKKYMKKIIEYFIFDGTGGSGKAKFSRFPADKILELNYKELPSSLCVYGKAEYYNKIWPRLIFSLRSKRGMPKSYPDCKNVASIRKWTKEKDGGYKGALHIRYK